MKRGTFGANGVVAGVVALTVAVGSWNCVASAVVSKVGQVAASQPTVAAVYDMIVGQQHADFTRLLGF